MMAVMTKTLDDNDFVRLHGHAKFDPLAGEPVDFNPPHEKPPDEPKRPSILIRTEERIVIDEAIAALADHPDVFHRGGALVHVITDEGRLANIIRPPGAPRIVPLPLARLRELMSDAARWLKQTEEGWKPAHPPDWAVRGVDARGTWPALRPLEAVVEAPVLRPDGTVLDLAGYDDATGLLFRPSVLFPTVPAKPTRPDAMQAAATLLDVVADFPFASEAHRSAWLSAVLTPLARFAFRGPAPLHLIDANVRGAGKSLLADTVAEIVLGRAMARMAPSEDDAEERKRITSLAMAVDRLVLIDNVAGEFGTPSLDAALTATEWRDRLLGTNTTLTWPLLCTWYATGNNVILSGDTSRRCVHIRIESRDEHPEDRGGFRHPDLLGWIRQRRPELVTAALTILRAHAVAGRPDMGLPPWGSFEGWSRSVREAIVWAGQADPGLTREELRRESDRDASALADLIAGWKEVAAEHGGQCTVAQMLSELDGPANAGKHERLRAGLAELVPTPPGKLPSPHRIGKVLAKFKGRVIRGRALVKASHRGMNGIAWRVDSVEPAAT